MSLVKKAVIALIMYNLIWGAAPPLFKWTLQEVGPFTLAFLRFYLAAVIIFPFAYKHLKVENRDIPLLIAAAFMGVTINISFFFIGLTYAPSINAAIIGSAGPIFLIFTSMYFLKEHARKKVLYGSYIALIGVLLIIAKPFFTHGANLSVIGNLLFVVSLIGTLAQTLILKKFIARYNPITITFWIFFISMISFLPFFIHEVQIQGFLTHLSMKGTTGIVFGAVFTSASAYYLYNWALKYLPASETGVFTYIDPIVTVLIAAPLLHEYPDIYFLFGALLVFGGLYIAEGKLPHHSKMHHYLKKK
jgi:drug/metabolite transporter (DMT)-like permease